MDRNQIYKQIVQLIAKQFDIKPDRINGKLNFKRDLDADSIDFVELVMNLEDHFGAKISDDDARKIQTVDEAVNYIAQHVQNN